MPKKYIATILLSILFVPAISLAQSSQTREQLIERIQTLIAFVKVLQAQLNGTAISSGNCVGIKNNLSYGIRDRTSNNEVSKLQRFLRDEGIFPPDLITGFFGPATESSVKRYQVDKGVISFGSPETTGYGAVGPKTRKSILNNCSATTTVAGNSNLQTEVNNISNTNDNKKLAVSNAKLSLEIKVNDKVSSGSLGETIDYKSNFNISWDTTGAKSCKTGGSNVPIVSGISGSEWSSASISTSGRGVLNASVKGLPISPGFVSISVDCKSSSGRSIRKSAMLTLKSDPSSASSLFGNIAPIRIISPNGSTRTAGSRMGVSWVTTIDTLEGGSVTARLIPVVSTGNLDDTNSHTFVSEDYTQKTGSLFSAIPSSIIAGKYIVEVKVTTPTGTKTQKSREFTVNAAPEVAVADTGTSITTPKAGQVWEELRENMIIWQGPVKKIRLLKDGVVVMPIGLEFPEVENYGFYGWFIPSGLVGIGYSIQTTSGSDFEDDQFEIAESAPFGIGAKGTGNTDGTAPSVPQNLAATAKTNKISLTWNASTDNIGVNEYLVYVGSTMIGSTGDTSFDHVGAVAGKTYTYSVRAVDIAGNISGSSLVTAPIALLPTLEILEWPESMDKEKFGGMHKIVWVTKNIPINTTAVPRIALVRITGANKRGEVRNLRVDANRITGSGSLGERTREINLDLTPGWTGGGRYYLAIIRTVNGVNVSDYSPEFIISSNTLGDSSGIMLGNNFHINPPVSRKFIPRGKEATMGWNSSESVGTHSEVYMIAPWNNEMTRLVVRNLDVTRTPGRTGMEVFIPKKKYNNVLKKFTDDVNHYKGVYYLGIIIYNGDDIVNIGTSSYFYVYGAGQLPKQKRAVELAWNGDKHHQGTRNIEIDESWNGFCDRVASVKNGHEDSCMALQSLCVNFVESAGLRYVVNKQSASSRFPNWTCWGRK